MVLQLLQRVRQEQEAIGARPRPQEAVLAAAKGTRRMTGNSRIGMVMSERVPGGPLAASLAEEHGVLGREAAACGHLRQAPLARAQGLSSRRVATANAGSMHDYVVHLESYRTCGIVGFVSIEPTRVRHD